MTDERIIAYLLKELTEEEQTQFEEACFAQESWPVEISLCEEDLIDAYLRDELTPRQRHDFERNYLTTPARQERIMVAAALLRHVDEKVGEQVEEKPLSTAEAVTRQATKLGWTERWRDFWSGQSRALRVAMTLGLIVITTGTLWFFAMRTRPPQTFASLTLTINLNNNRAEGVQANKIKLPSDVDALRISLILPEQQPTATRYRAEIVNNDGETGTVQVSGQDAQTVSVVIPASELTRGQYALKLFAIRPDNSEQPFNGHYFFIVE